MYHKMYCSFYKYKDLVWWNNTIIINWNSLQLVCHFYIIRVVFTGVLSEKYSNTKKNIKLFLLFSFIEKCWLHSIEHDVNCSDSCLLHCFFLSWIYNDLFSNKKTYLHNWVSLFYRIPFENYWVLQICWHLQTLLYLHQYCWKKNHVKKNILCTLENSMY